MSVLEGKADFPVARPTFAGIQRVVGGTARPDLPSVAIIQHFYRDNGKRPMWRHLLIRTIRPASFRPAMPDGGLQRGAPRSLKSLSPHGLLCLSRKSVNPLCGVNVKGARNVVPLRVRR
jgi:hypothetical protein